MAEQHFNGTDFDHNRDGMRLATQHERVKHMALNWPGGWFTMQELSEDLGEPWGSVERQVRYLRSKRFGGYYVEKRHKSGGTFEYRVRAAFTLDGGSVDDMQQRVAEAGLEGLG